MFKRGELITPDQVRGKHKTLEEAVLRNAWPTLAAARGKVVFLMDQRPVGPVYLKGHPSLRGRIIFTNAEPGQPDCAFTEENDGTQELIAALVRKGAIWCAREPTRIPSRPAATIPLAERSPSQAVHNC